MHIPYIYHSTFYDLVIFPQHGRSEKQVWQIVGAMANRWLDVIESKGSTMTNDEARVLPRVLRPKHPGLGMGP